MRNYRCPGKQQITAPVARCLNKYWLADKLEALVWKEIERVLDNPDFVIAAIENQRDSVNNLGILEPELQQVERQLRALNRKQKQLLQWAQVRYHIAANLSTNTIWYRASMMAILLRVRYEKAA